MNEFFEIYIKPLNDELGDKLNDDTRAYERTWEIAVRNRDRIRKLQDKENRARLAEKSANGRTRSNRTKVS